MEKVGFTFLSSNSAAYGRLVLLLRRGNSADEVANELSGVIWMLSYHCVISNF